MSTPTRVSNYALGHLGVSKTIDNFDTEKSANAAVCRLWYAQCRDEVLRDFVHPFTTEIGSLGLVETTPNNEWGYSYRYPSNCLMFRKIQSGIRNDTRQSKIPYRIGRDSTGKLVFTDQQNAVAEWTVKETDLSRWPVDLIQVLSLLLAAYIAPSVTAGDPNKLGERAAKFYLAFKAKAEANALNEEQDEEPPQSQFIRDRE